MEIKLSEHMMTTENGTHLYVTDNGSDDGQVTIRAIASGCCLNVDLTVDELQRFQRLIGDAINEAFKVQPALKCPACGYDKDTAMYAGDHRNCRRFPFFPGEKGKSHAKEF